MTPKDRVRITFSCPTELREKLTKKADSEGIPRSQLIVELLDHSLGGLSSEGQATDATVNRFLFDIQKRIGDLEGWKREINSWKGSADVDRLNLEETMGEILTDQVKEGGADTTRKASKKKIPSPKKRK